MLSRGIFRTTPKRLGGVTSNLLAPPESGRWFNPPHVWTAADFLFPVFFAVSAPGLIWMSLYGIWYLPMYSHYQDQHYYHRSPYTKEFMEKYNRMERWRHY